MNVKKQADNAVMASRFLADARFQVYLDYARRHVDTVDRERLVDLAVRLYRWNVEASAITIGYIGYIEIFVRNAIDHRLCEWVSGQQITGIPDWLEAGKSDPIGRIRALINSPERDYIAEARNTALLHCTFAARQDDAIQGLLQIRQLTQLHSFRTKLPQRLHMLNKRTLQC